MCVLIVLIVSSLYGTIDRTAIDRGVIDGDDTDRGVVDGQCHGVVNEGTVYGGPTDDCVVTEHAIA